MSRADAILRQLTGYRMRRATHPVLALVNETLAPHGLRRTTFSALAVASEKPGIRQSGLADTLGIERPNIVNILDDLEKAGLVLRESVPEDRRGCALRATVQGKAVLQEALASLQNVERRLIDGLSEKETAQIHRALDVIEANAENMRKNDVQSSGA